VFVFATSNHDVVERLGIGAHLLDGVSVIEVGGELDLWTAPTLCSRIEQAFLRPAARILVDLSQLQFCDSTGLRALAGVAHEASVRRVRMLIVPPARSGASRAFEVGGAAEFLPLADDVDRGLAALPG
jgi:anti-anti-sigma factor